MKPNMEINFSSYSAVGTHIDAYGENENNVFLFNSFKVEIEATNDYTNGDINK